jgi:hypothetical protein
MILGKLSLIVLSTATLYSITDLFDVDSTTQASLILGENQTNNILHSRINGNRNHLAENPNNQVRASKKFDGDFYKGIYADVDQLIQEGKYSSSLDYYEKVGQFKATKKEAFFMGSPGNDVVLGFGDDVDLYGISYQTTIKNDKIAVFTPNSLGVGEFDILVGRNEGVVEDGFFLSALTGDHERTGQNGAGSSAKLYVGQGDKDHALIYNFNSDNDYVSLSGKVSDYKFESRKGDFYISTKEGDLVGIVKNAPELKVRRFLKDGTFRLSNKPKIQHGFNDGIYLAINPQAQLAIDSGSFTTIEDYYVKAGSDTVGYFTGTTDAKTSDQKTLNDTVFGLGSKNIIAGVGLKLSGGKGTNIKLEVLTTGKGEQDTLVGTDGASNEFWLGYQKEVFYVGNAGKDFALIENFQPGEDSLLMSGKPSDYTFAAVDGGVDIASKGDLIAKIKGINTTQLTLNAPDANTGTFTVTAKKD